MPAEISLSCSSNQLLAERESMAGVISEAMQAVEALE